MQQNIKVSLEKVREEKTPRLPSQTSACPSSSQFVRAEKPLDSRRAKNHALTREMENNL